MDRLRELTEKHVEIRRAASAFGAWWSMVEAQEELAGEPIKDGDIVLHFSGSGASTMVTAKQLRDMMDAIFGPRIDRPRTTA